MVPYFNTVAVQASFLTTGMVDGYLPDDLYDRWGEGALELHNTICQYAEPLCRINAALSSRYSFPGVFEYDVSEQLGIWFSDTLMGEGAAPTVEHTNLQMATLVIEFMAKGNHGQGALALVSEQLSLSDEALQALAALHCLE